MKQYYYYSLLLFPPWLDETGLLQNGPPDCFSVELCCLRSKFSASRHRFEPNDTHKTKKRHRLVSLSCLVGTTGLDETGLLQNSPPDCFSVELCCLRSKFSASRHRFEPNNTHKTKKRHRLVSLSCLVGTTGLEPVTPCL